MSDVAELCTAAQRSVRTSRAREYRDVYALKYLRPFDHTLMTAHETTRAPDVRSAAASSRTALRDAYAMRYVSRTVAVRAQTVERVRPDTRDSANVIIRTRTVSLCLAKMVNSAGSAFMIGGTSGDKRDMCAYVLVTNVSTVHCSLPGSYSGAHGRVRKCCKFGALLGLKIGRYM